MTGTVKNLIPLLPILTEMSKCQVCDIKYSYVASFTPSSGSVLLSQNCFTGNREILKARLLCK